ncbi:MAG: autoinducer binding domain-containing protein [Rhodanobacter sp.]
MKAWREDCLARLTAPAGSIDPVVRELAAIVQELGFEYCSYVMRMPFPLGNPVVTWSSTYPERWLEHYFSHDYLSVDPLLQQVLDDPFPVVWNDQSFPNQPEFWEEARAHGIRYGWALTSYGKQATVGMLSLARSHHLVTESELAATEAKLVWLSHVVHGTISAMNISKPGPDQELTAREREVLRWTAAGKTADEVGTILGISERTVTFHITSSLVKLDVVNKTQAVAKALLLNIL